MLGSQVHQQHGGDRQERRHCVVEHQECRGCCAGVAVVADAGDLPERVPVEEEAADAQCAGVSLLEYMDSIACEDLSDSGEASPDLASGRPASARWLQGGDDGVPAAPDAGVALQGAWWMST